MRLTAEQIRSSRSIVARHAGTMAQVRLSGSRLDDNARGGHDDLLVEIPRPVQSPAPLAARIVGRIIRARGGRKVDVILLATDNCLFSGPFTPARARTLEEDEDRAEQVEAFVSRFGRLQDTLGNELLPTPLTAHGERTATFLKKLDQAEHLGLARDAQAWHDMRRLSNQMGHEHIEDPVVLASALEAGYAFAPERMATAQRLGA